MPLRNVLFAGNSRNEGVLMATLGTNPSNHLNAKLIGKNGVMLRAKNTDTTIALMGSTAAVNTPNRGAGREGYEFVFYPERDTPALVAINIVMRQTGAKGFPMFIRVPAFLRITWQDGAPVIDLDECWRPEQHVGFIDDRCISATLENGKCVTSDGSAGGARARFDDIVRYLFGLSTAEELLASTTEKPELERLRGEVEELTCKLGTARAEVEVLRTERDTARDDLYEMASSVQRIYARRWRMIDRFRGTDTKALFATMSKVWDHCEWFQMRRLGIRE